MAYIRLAFLTLRNRILEEIRYPFQFIFNTIFFIGFAYFVSLGGQIIQGNTSSDSMNGTISSFFLAFLAGGALGQPIETLDKSKMEEFYLQPLTSSGYIIAVAVGRAIETTVTLSVYTGIISLFRSTNLDAMIRIAIVGFPVFFGMLGVGFGIAGLRLVFQKVGALPQLASIVLLGIAISSTPNNLQAWINWQPFAAGLYYLRTGNLNILTFFLSVVFSILFGALIFYWGERTMLRRGLISQE